MALLVLGGVAVTSHAADPVHVTGIARSGSGIAVRFDALQGSSYRLERKLDLTAHRAFDYAQVVRCAPLIVDATNATRGVPDGLEKVVRIGAPM